MYIRAGSYRQKSGMFLSLQPHVTFFQHSEVDLPEALFYICSTGPQNKCFPILKAVYLLVEESRSPDLFSWPVLTWPGTSSSLLSF